jgi:hypothetical protein
MGKQEYIKIGLNSGGVICIVEGLKMLIEDFDKYWVWGNAFIILGAVLLRLGLTLKSDFKKAIEYLEEAKNYAFEKSKIEVSGILSINELKNLNLDIESYFQFERNVLAGLTCIYEKEVSRKITTDIPTLNQEQIIRDYATINTADLIKSAYQKLGIYLLGFSDHPPSRRKEFEYSDLKDYSYFLKRKDWRKRIAEIIGKKENQQRS